MEIEVKVPMLPESISDALVSVWHKKAGDTVTRDENIVDLETDKVMLEVPAPMDGVIKQIVHNTGDIVQAQEVLAIIESGAPAKDKKEEKKEKEEKGEKKEKVEKKEREEKEEKVTKTSPSVRRLAEEKNINLSNVQGTGKDGRITKDNVMGTGPSRPMSSEAAGMQNAPTGARPEQRVPMTRIRAKIAERLLAVTNETAMLTTFNEINMAHVMAIRARYREAFQEKYHIRLGFMSFFVSAVVEALKRSPIVNASIDGNDIIYHGYYDVGVAVSTDRGLIVPVLRDVDQLSMAAIEEKIVEFADRARSGKLSLEDIQGGTFTITNGGVFGSLLATPLLNAPQAAILGMHKIQERPIVENGQIVIRPMMYVALSYDHRLIDGKESVTFLMAIKELLEDPTRLLLEV